MSYNEWLDIDVLEDYLDGKLDAKTMHKVEKLSLEDPFIAEALAGLSQSPKRTQTLSILQKQLRERVLQKPVTEKRWKITAQRLSIASAAAVLFVTVSILFWMKENKRQELMVNKSKKVDVRIAPPTVKITPEAKSTPPPAIVEKTPIITLADNNIQLQQAAKAKKVVSITNKLANSVSGNAIAYKADTIGFAASPINTAERKKEGEIADEQKVVLFEKKAAPIRERALPGKVDGIYVETNVGLRGSATIINGIVYAKTGGQPLPGAIVKVSGTNKATTTNSKGEFTLPVDSNMQSLSVAYIGFTSQEIKAQPNQQVAVALEEAKGSLSEVIVAPNVNDISPLPPHAQLSGYFPLGGWPDFEAYLINNNALTEKGLAGKDVVLKFEVKDNGSPINIVVIKSQGKVFDTEAIRLLKDGPKWIPNQKGKKGTAQILVKF